MKILLITWNFAPLNSMGSVRLTKLASFLLENGHDVRVITVGKQKKAGGLEDDFPAERVIYTYSINLQAPFEKFSKFLKIAKTKVKASETVPDGNLSRNTQYKSKFGKFLKNFYNDITMLMNLPDKRIGWFPFAYWSLRKLSKAWKPDMIYASGPPFTALVIAATAAKRLNVKWCAELRDPWAGSGYSESEMYVYRSIQQSLERRTLSSASGIVTTIEALSDLYASRYNKMTLTIKNGVDITRKGSAFTETKISNNLKLKLLDNKKVNIIYTGSIYKGKRDPSPLFLAFEHLSKFEKDMIAINFYGNNMKEIKKIAESFCVLDNVNIFPADTHSSSLELQKAADCLLLLQWNNKLEKFHMPGKLFEYIGAQKPIIGIGFLEGVPCEIIRSRNLGIYDNDPIKISKFLRKMIQEKIENGKISLTKNVVGEFSRVEQFRILERNIVKMYKEIN